MPYKRNRVAALVVEGNSILLAEHRKDGKVYYLLPGGGVEKGEYEEDALKRELLEESGLSANPVKFMFQTVTISPDKSRHIIQKVYLSKVSGTISPSKDPRVAKVAYFTKDKFMKLKFYPNIRNEIISAWENGFTNDAMSLSVPWED